MRSAAMLRAFSVAAVAVIALWASAPQPRAQGELKSDQDVEQLFATACGWCHQDGGRSEGKGPALMGTKRSDEYIMNRIATGKPGRMPAFGQTLTIEQVDAIIHYIRNLKPEGAAAP
jgi:mono/diheme cytochrome c family protein